MAIDAKVIWELAKSIWKGGASKQSTTVGTVSMTDDSGTTWVDLEGGTSPVPISGSVVETNIGDVVDVRISGGRAYVTGSTSNRAVGGTQVTRAVRPVAEVATLALNNAQKAHDAADVAEKEAERAHDAADDAQASADEAAASALIANGAANSALTQLSVVEDVAGTLTWISEHGSYVLTTDTEVVDGRVYFALSQGEYTPVINPAGNPSSHGWYVLDVTDSQAEYVMAHLAVTSSGLWVLPSGLGTAQTPDVAPGYKMLLSASSSKIYDATGAQVASYGTETVIGRDNESRVEIDYHSLKMVDKYGNTYVHLSDLRDADGNATVTEFFRESVESDSQQYASYVILQARPESIVQIKYKDSQYGEVPSWSTSVSSVHFSELVNHPFTVKYVTRGSDAKAYTLGTRNFIGIEAQVGLMSFVTGISNIASAEASFSEGASNVSSGNASHVGGQSSKASGDYSFAHGLGASAIGFVSCAIGRQLTASGDCSFAQGYGANASGKYSCALGEGTKASGDYSFAHGLGASAIGDTQVVIGRYNVEDATKALIIGNGTSTYSNALTVDWSGNVNAAGNVNGTGGTMTGSVRIKDNAIDRDSSPSSSLYSDSHAFDLLDKDGELMGKVRLTKSATGNAGIQLVAWNEADGGSSSAHYNVFHVGINKDGTRTYAMSDPAAFRSALGLAKTATDITRYDDGGEDISQTIVDSGSVRLVRNAVMVTVHVNAVSLADDLASGSSIAIGTVPTGYRPSYEADSVCTSTSNSQLPIRLYVTTGGNVTLQNRTGANLPASRTLYGTVTYVI